MVECLESKLVKIRKPHRCFALAACGSLKRGHQCKQINALITAKFIQITCAQPVRNTRKNMSTMNTTKVILGKTLNCGNKFVSKLKEN